MAQQRVLEAILRLSFDRRALGEGKTGLGLVKKELVQLEGEANKLRTAIASALAQGRNVDKLKQDLTSVEQAMENVRQNARQGLAEALFRQTKEQLDQLQERADRLERVSTSVAVLGGGILAGFYALAQGYVDRAGMVSETGRAWLAVNEELQRSYRQIGQVAAQSLLPFLESAAEVMQSATSFAKEHPGAVNAVMKLAGGAALVGTLGTLVSKGIKLYADVKYLAAVALQNKAADKMLAAAGIQSGAAGKAAAGGLLGKIGLGSAAGSAAGGAGLTAGGVGLAIGGGLLAGVGINELLARSSVGQAMGMQTFGKFASVGGYQLGKLFGGEELGKQWFANIAYTFGEIDEAARQAAYGLEETKGALEQIQIPQAALDAFEMFRQEQVEAEEEYHRQRADVVKSYSEQVVRTTEQYEKQRADLVDDYEKRRKDAVERFSKESARLVEDFEIASRKAIQNYQRNVRSYLESAREQELKAEQAYYQNRQKLVEQYGIEARRAEEEHQKEMRRLQEDHQLALEDAIANQDAVAFLREQRSYELQRRRNEEDYRDEVEQRNSEQARRLEELDNDFAAEREARQREREKRLAEMKEQFELEQRERQEDFQRRQQQREEDFQEQLRQMQEQHQERLDELDNAHREQISQLRSQLREQLQTLETHYNEEKQRRERAFADQLRDLDAALLGEQQTRRDYYEQMEKDFTDWLKSMQGKVGSNKVSYPKRAAGGYVGSGLYQLGEQGREFVLSNATTQNLEKQLGPLSQGKILASLAGGQKQRVQMNYSPTYYFEERQDAREIMATISREIDNKLMRLERGY